MTGGDWQRKGEISKLRKEKNKKEKCGRKRKRKAGINILTEVNIKEGKNKVGEENKEQGRNGTTKMKNEENKYANESKEQRNKGGRKGEFL